MFVAEGFYPTTASRFPDIPAILTSFKGHFFGKGYPASNKFVAPAIIKSKAAEFFFHLFSNNLFAFPAIASVLYPMTEGVNDVIPSIAAGNAFGHAGLGVPNLTEDFRILLL